MKTNKKSKTTKSGEFKSRGPFEAKSKVAKPSIRKTKPAENASAPSASGTPAVSKTPNKLKSTRPKSRSNITPSASGTPSRTPGSNQKSAENANIPGSLGLSKRSRSNQKSVENANIPSSLGLSRRPRSNRKSAELARTPSSYGTPRSKGKSGENANIPSTLGLSRRPRSNRKSAELARTPSAYGTPRSKGKSAENTRSASGTPGRTPGSRPSSQSGNTTNLTRSRTRSGTPMTPGNGQTPSFSTGTPGESQERTPNWQKRRNNSKEEEEEEQEEDSDQENGDALIREMIGTKETIDGGKRTLYFKTNKLKTIENFLCYIGCSFPNIRNTIFPIALLNFFLVFFSQTVKVINELWAFDKEKKYKYFKPFGKVDQFNLNSIFDKLEVGRSLRGKAPSMDLAIMFCAFLSIVFIGIRHKAIILVCIFSLPIWFLALSHIKGFYYMGLFAFQIIDQFLAVVLRVLAMESVPKYHRTLAFICVQISTVFGIGLSRVFVMATTIKINTFFHLATLITLGLCCHVVINIHDSLFNLLTIGDFNRLEHALHRYITLAKLKMQAAVTVDNLAFETFENNEILTILVDTLKTHSLMYELVACSILSALCLNVYAYIDKEISESTKLAMFDKLMLSPAAFTVAIGMMTFFMFVLPKCRLLPITIASLLVFPSWYLMQLNTSHTHNLIPCEDKGHSQVGNYYVFGAVITMGIVDMMRLFLHIHLLEHVPSIVRVPALACFRMLEYTIDGSIREFMPAEGLNSSFGMHIFFLLPLGVWLLTPKKVFGLTVYFSEVRSIVEKQHKLQPAPKDVE